MKNPLSNILNKEINVKARILSEEGEARIESGKLTVGDVPAFFGAVMASNAKIRGRKVSDYVKGKFANPEPPKFDPEIHLKVEVGDVVFYKDTRWVVWNTKEEGALTRLAQWVAKPGTDPYPHVIDRVLLKTEAALVDRDYMTAREYQDLMSSQFADRREF